jgi:hypothetical protein
LDNSGWFLLQNLRCHRHRRRDSPNALRRAALLLTAADTGRPPAPLGPRPLRRLTLGLLKMLALRLGGAAVLVSSFHARRETDL